MANDILYVNPASELQHYIFDFSDDLTGDTTLKAIGAGSTITAFDSSGVDQSSTVL